MISPAATLIVAFFRMDANLKLTKTVENASAEIFLMSKQYRPFLTVLEILHKRNFEAPVWRREYSDIVVEGEFIRMRP